MHVRPVTQGVAESSHQQGRQKGRPELAISLQKANSTPRKGRICPGHGGRGVFHTRHGVRTQVLVATRKADSRAVHGEPQEGHGVRRHRQRRQAVLSDVRSVRRAYLYRVSQGDAEAFWKGSGSSGQGLSASRKICQGIAAGKQEHQDHIPSKRVAVPQCGRRVLAPGKASSARLRILQDLHGHVQCSLYVL